MMTTMTIMTMTILTMTILTTKPLLVWWISGAPSSEQDAMFSSWTMLGPWDGMQGCLKRDRDWIG